MGTRDLIRTHSNSYPSFITAIKQRAQLFYFLIRLCLQVWKSHGLKVQGKVLLLKAYVHPAISNEREARAIPTKYRDEIT